MKKGVAEEAEIIESAEYSAEKDPAFMKQIEKFGFSTEEELSKKPTKEELLKYQGYRAYEELITTEIRFIKELGFFGKKERDILQNAFEEAKKKKLPDNSARWEDLEPLLNKMEEIRQGHLDFLKVLRDSPPSTWAAKLEEIQKVEAEYAILQTFFLKKTLPENVRMALSVAEEKARKNNPELPERFGFDELPSFLIKPVQRIAKYPLFMRQLYSSSTLPKNPFSKNNEQFEKVAEHVNNAVNKAEKAEKAKLMAADLSEIVMRENKKKPPRKQDARDKALGIIAVFSETAHQLKLQTKNPELSKENPFVLAFKKAYRQALEGRVLGKEALDPEHQSSFDFAIESLSPKKLAQWGTSKDQLTQAKKAVLEEFKLTQQSVKSNTPAAKVPQPPATPAPSKGSEGPKIGRRMPAMLDTTREKLVQALSKSPASAPPTYAPPPVPKGSTVARSSAPQSGMRPAPVILQEQKNGVPTSAATPPAVNDQSKPDMSATTPVDDSKKLPRVGK